MFARTQHSLAVILLSPARGEAPLSILATRRLRMARRPLLIEAGVPASAIAQAVRRIGTGRAEIKARFLTLISQ